MKIIGNIWVLLFILVNLVNICALFYLNPLSVAWDKLTVIYSPFNLKNIIFAVISLSPAILFFWWSDKLKVKRLRREWEEWAETNKKNREKQNIQNN